MEYILCVRPAYRVLYRDLDNVNHVEHGAKDFESAIDELFKFDLMAKSGNLNNVHKPTVLEAFPRIEGRIYILTEIDANILANTGRDMSDVRYFQYNSDTGLYATLFQVD